VSSRRKSPHLLTKITVVAGTVGATFGLRLLLAPVLHDRQPYMLFYAAVAWTAWQMGWRPAAVAAVASAFIAFWAFVPPAFTLHWQNPGDLLALAGFLIISATLIFFIENAERSSERAVRVAEEATRREVELRKKEEQQDLLLDAARFGTCEWRLADDSLTWSKEHFELLGYEPHSFQPSLSHFRDRIHPEDLAAFDSEVAAARRERRLARAEFRVQLPGGDLRWVNAIGRFSYDERGDAVSLSGLLMDVTERARAEQASRFLAALVESADEAIVSKDLTGRITSWNEGAQRLFGYTAAEAIGQPITILIPEALRQEESEMLARVRAGERVKDLETIRRRKDETLLDVWVTASAIRDAKGNVIGLSKIARDISARKAAERRAQTENAAIRALAAAETIAEGVEAVLRAVCQCGGWDCGGHWERVENTDEVRCAAFWMAGRSPELKALEEQSRGRAFVAGRGIPGRVLAAAKPEWVTDLARDDNIPRASHALAAGLRTACAVPVSMVDRVVGVLEFFSAERRKADDAFLQMMRSLGAQLGEFIHRKRVENQLRAAQQQLEVQAARLETAVEERTEELRQSLQSVENLCYTIAHDLRAPLRGMQGFARALMEDHGASLDNLGASYAQRIVRAAVRMDALITDLLAYGRLGTADVTAVQIELDTIIDSFLADYAEEIKTRCATICVERMLPVVIANRTMLTQVTANLLLNAMKFVAPGVAPNIRVFAEPKENRVRLCIEDNGIGIAAEHRGKLFQIFQRLHGPEQYPGTGMGLAIAKRAMERMGGTVGFTSQAGSGSTFWIDLPRAGALASPKQPLTQSKATGT